MGVAHASFAVKTVARVSSGFPRYLTFRIFGSADVAPRDRGMARETDRRDKQ
jgi:hypothetical protein